MSFETAMKRAATALNHAETAAALLRYVSSSDNPTEAYKAGYGIEHASAAVRCLKESLKYAESALEEYKSIG